MSVDARETVGIQIRVTHFASEVWVQVTGHGRGGTPRLTPTVRSLLPADLAELPLKRYVPGVALTGQYTDAQDIWVLDNSRRSCDA